MARVHDGSRDQIPDEAIVQRRLGPVQHGLRKAARPPSPAVSGARQRNAREPICRATLRVLRLRARARARVRGCGAGRILLRRHEHHPLGRGDLTGAQGLARRGRRRQGDVLGRQRSAASRGVWGAFRRRLGPRLDHLGVLVFLVVSDAVGGARLLVSRGGQRINGGREGRRRGRRRRRSHEGGRLLRDGKAAVKGRRTGTA
mmetsp:Transcript_5817/g.22677  ORF Transcript_5817/g.22677 Transcript_5817/m.22677 type:complete len:202 (+) Transcript_5817:459-1064(+)